MGGGGQQTTQSGPPGWAAPTGGGILADVGQLLGLGTGQLPVMPGNLNQKVADFTPYQQQALGMIGQQSGTSGQLAASGAHELNATLRGQFLDPSTNPYLKATADAANQATVDQYNQSVAPSQMVQAQLASGGGTGALAGSGFQQAQMNNEQVLARQLGQQDAQIYSGNYQQERQNQIGALGQLGAAQQALYQPGQELFSAGLQQQQQKQLGLNTNWQNALRANQYPWQQLEQAANIFGGVTGQSATVNTSGGK